MKFDDGYFITPLPTPTDISSLIRAKRGQESVAGPAAAREGGS